MSDQAKSIKQRNRLFISYRRVEPDQTVGRRVADALRELHEVFIDEAIIPGCDWGEDINNALQTAEFLIVFLSERAARSEMVVEEVRTAHERSKETGLPATIPVRLGFDGPLPYPLSAYVNRFQHLSWRGAEDTPQLIHQLTEAVAERPTKKFGGTAPASVQPPDRLPGVFQPVL
jgi:serine/threonine-protein kinase